MDKPGRYASEKDVIRRAIANGIKDAIADCTEEDTIAFSLVDCIYERITTPYIIETIKGLTK